MIQPQGAKYRFGKETIEMLHGKKESTPGDLIEGVLSKHTLLDLKQLIQHTSLDEHVVKEAITKGVEDRYLIEVSRQKYSLTKTFNKLKDEMTTQLEDYHQTFPMRLGMSKAELVQLFSEIYQKSFVEYSLNQFVEDGDVQKEEQFVSLAGFYPDLPKQWKQRMLEVIATLEKDGVSVKKWEEYVTDTPLSKVDANELAVYLVQTKQAYRFMEDRLIHQSAVDGALKTLREQTNDTFGIKEAKDTLAVSRKYLIPFLELLDQLKITTRIEDKRKWISQG
ncbi:SelB domain-containing protein [Halobacillus shinanisalinarum]|uniref:SelB domain-containing protein n=1 Tax=Halobacillus shinanisalinarum TaxID=2932258 RepID=UPI002962176E|nr:SelB C-terminal domain-containing protein [Halobacillus shinanisalinarum]